MSAPLKRWMGRSVVVDEAGEPLRVYRGQHGAGAGSRLQTRLPSITFCSKEVATTYALEPNDTRDTAVSPRVLEAYLRIERPVIMHRDDPFIDFIHIIKAIGPDKAATIAKELAPWVEDTSPWHEGPLCDDFADVADLVARAPDRLAECYVEAYVVFDVPKYVNWFRQAGYDGAIHCGNGESAGDVEYKVFSADQVLLVDDMEKAVALSGSAVKALPELSM